MIATTFAALLESLTKERTEEKQSKSWAWFMAQAKKVRTLAEAIKPSELSPQQAVKDPGVPKFKGTVFPKILTGTDSIIGKMILFQYDPKHKATLPYYDQFPLIFPIQILNDGYLGLNLHYLPLPFRARLMDSLYSLLINKEKLDEKSRLKISYETLQSYARFRYYKPTIKRYLYNHVRSKWSIIPGNEWDAAMCLPLQRFVKAPETKVWGDSTRMIQRL